MSVTISRLTREYLFWPIQTSQNLSGSAVEVALMDNPVDLPEESDWHTAQLVSYSGSPFAVRLLVGPDHVDAVELMGDTDYQAWVRITDDPERPVRKISTVTVE